MGLISAVLGLPLAPIRGVIKLGEVIQDQVEQELHSPAALRRELEAVEKRAASGELSPEERRAAEDEVLARATGSTGTAPSVRGTASAGAGTTRRRTPAVRRRRPEGPAMSGEQP